MNIHWPEKISNVESVPHVGGNSEKEVGLAGSHSEKNRWQCNKEGTNLESPKKRKRGRPRQTLRRDLSKDVADLGIRWQQLVTTAQDRARWRVVVDGLTSRRRNGP